MKKISTIVLAVLPLCLGCLDGPLDVSGEAALQGGADGTPMAGGNGVAAGGAAGHPTGGGAVARGTAGVGAAWASNGGAPGSGGTAASAPVAPGAVIHLSFDEDAGAKLTDSSGHGNNGFLMQGSVDPSPMNLRPKWSAGESGGGADGSVELNGVDEWVRISDSPSIDLTGTNNAVSLSVWVYVIALRTIKPGSVVVQRHILGTRGEHFMLGILNGAPYAGQNHMGTTGPQDMPLGRWVHMALTFDGLTLTLFVDGKDVAHLDTGVPIGFDQTALSIGGGINESDVIEFLNARVDEFQMYARALSAAEVRKLSGR